MREVIASRSPLEAVGPEVKVHRPTSFRVTFAERLVHFRGTIRDVLGLEGHSGGGFAPQVVPSHGASGSRVPSNRLKKQDNCRALEAPGEIWFPAPASDDLATAPSSRCCPPLHCDPPFE